MARSLGEGRLRFPEVNWPEIEVPPPLATLIV